MRKIKIFIAGSKELIQERNYIKVLANDLNSKYSTNDVLVIIHSYEHFDDKQDEYNRFISEEADIVIFILDGRIGEKTEDEFIKATNSLNKENRPEVMVFLHEFEEITPDIARIQGLLRGCLGDRYYIEYSTLDDIKAKARDRIIRFIDHYDEVRPSSGSRCQVSKKRSKVNRTSPNNSIARSLLWLMAGIILVLSGLLCFSVFSSSDLLIFAGGGSVKNYVENQRKVDIVEYPHSVYANLASGSAWALLLEEANRYQEDGGKGQEHFSSICLSAADIDSVFINEKTKGIFANARIIRYHLGQDPLVVYVHKSFAYRFGIQDNAVSISADSLRLMVKYALSNPQAVRLFTTSTMSGTLRLYQSCFTNSDSVDFKKLLEQKQSNLFYQKSSSTYINALDLPASNLPYIILGSQNYYPQKLDDEKEKHYQSLYVKDGNNNISKPMNLYFVGECTKDGDYCTIKKPVIKFLKDIHADEDIDTETWRDLLNAKMKTEGGNVILYLN